jgi:peptidoglycan/LPS O-acetylase OafA/YrhL
VLPWVMPLALPYLLFWLALHPSIRLNNFARYGDFSYGTYLYAFPIQQLLICWLPAISPPALFVIAAPASIAAGAVSWYAVERRFMRRRGTAGQPPPRTLMRPGCSDRFWWSNDSRTPPTGRVSENNRSTPGN